MLQCSFGVCLLMEAWCRALYGGAHERLGILWLNGFGVVWRDEAAMYGQFLAVLNPTLYADTHGLGVLWLMWLCMVYRTSGLLTGS
jgi:hypothetical protein